jgi:hypothetical protein|tara:strand:- start:4775 stop:5398 length:624 start_codon:yes stop_codon:yes gene_type:complete
MNINLVDISEIKPYENNPRIKSNITKVAESIKKFGFQQPIVVDRQNIIIVGHSRYEASKQLNLQKIPVLVAENMSAEDVKAYRIADNRTNQDSEWDFPKLNKEFGDLLDMNFDLTELGFDEKEIENMITFKGDETYFDSDMAREHWTEMPDFIHEDNKPYRTIFLHFDDDKQVEEFAQMINQIITDKTKTIYFKEREQRVLKDKVYE